jgi:hypothetical protein
VIFGKPISSSELCEGAETNVSQEIADALQSKVQAIVDAEKKSSKAA